MSIYQFAPSSVFSQMHPFVTWEGAFTDSELDLIVEYCKSLPQTAAYVNNGDTAVEDEAVRVSNLAWVSNNPETGWIYDKLAYVARNLNAKFFNLDLYGFVEDFQFTEYSGDSAGHYTWHTDMSSSVQVQRKFSLVLQLTDPELYEGGELQTFTGPEPVTVQKQRGLIAAFPSWALHRVTPVTSGTRHTLVAWTAGPDFK